MSRDEFSFFIDLNETDVNRLTKKNVFDKICNFWSQFWKTKIYGGNF